MTLVLFHPRDQELRLWKPGSKRPTFFEGKPWVIWTNLWFAMEQGWEVIGEL